jgi:virginiamycin A acetyltransferase
MKDMADGTSYSASEFKDEFFSCGRYTSIAGGCTFHGPDNHPWVTDNKCVTNYPFGDKNPEWDFPRCSGKGRGSIGNDVWIGQGVRVLSGVHIGDGAIIGAGSVIVKDVPPYAVAVGNPGKVTKFRFTPEQIEVLQRVEWWNWNDEEIRKNLGLLADINKFMEKYG